MNKAAVMIRHADLEDAQLLADLGASTFYDTFAEKNTSENMKSYLAGSFSLEKQTSEMNDKDTVFLIAEIDGEPAGYAMLRAGGAPAGIRGVSPIEVVRIYAQKKWIGHGVGAALMQACLEEAARLKHDTLWLGVWEHNPHAIAFYRKWNLVEAGIQVFRLGNDLQRDLVMQRPVKVFL